ncbi:MAG: ferredoxin [Tardiphaga sp.]|uniref:Rieske (2Fe-2S) protein n=1 Tax=Tardiphaga sp. TaxID=1926292 RepID=UPI00260C2318|nr:Rieske (2Fe-2S) protein [Tardiphaga sp.]MDB5501825.1 ferredoxin [Tardiphaga sp.]
MSDAPISAGEQPGRWVAVCARERLTQHRIVCATIAGVGLLVVADGDQVHACERACPHEQADLSLGRVADGRLYCPRHLAWFDLTDGHISPGWPSRALRRYPVRIAEGHVWVDAGAL